MPKFELPINNNQLLANAFITHNTVNLKSNEPFNTMAVKVLFDTGATGSAIISRVAKDLNLIPISQSQLQTASGLSTVNIYEINLLLPLPTTEMTFGGKVKVSEIADNNNFDVIIGMDIIRMGVLIVSSNTFTFCI